LVFERQPLAAFQKPILGFANPKIGFIMRIAGFSKILGLKSAQRGFKEYRKIFESAASRHFQKFLWVSWQR
jgi:hypothetical protein